MTKKLLQQVDKLTILAPALMPAYGDRGKYQRAIKAMQKAGLEGIWAPNVTKVIQGLSRRDQFSSMPLAQRLDDLEGALKSESEVIICAIGGYNTYQLLDYIDWQLVRSAQKVFIGYSDATVLMNAIYRKTDNLSWYGLNARNLGDTRVGNISTVNLRKILRTNSITWKPLKIYADSFTTPMRRVNGWATIRPGAATGIGVGGNLGTFFLLQGTPYMPNFDEPTVLFVEEDDMPGKFAINEFDRKLRSILDQKNAKQNIKALIIGRFLDSSQTTTPMIKKIIDEIQFFDDKPVIANVEIGHGMPRILLPIGGRIDINTAEKKIVVYNSEKGS